MIYNISNVSHAQPTQKPTFSDKTTSMTAQLRLSNLIGPQEVHQPQKGPVPPPVSSLHLQKPTTADSHPPSSEEAIVPYTVPESEPIHDCDTPYEEDPVFCTDYVNDVHAYYRKMELDEKYRPIDYLSKQPQMQPLDRDKFVNSMIELHMILKQLNSPLTQDTLYLAVNLFDRFLSKRVVARDKLPLLMLTSFYVASKFEDTNYPLMTDLLTIAKEGLTKKDMIIMERIILQKLEFRLGAPTAFSFLRRYVHCAECEGEVGLTARCLCELSLMSYTLSIRFPPSMVAASALAHSLRINGKEPWTHTLQYYSQYSYNDLRPCMIEMRELVKRIPLMKYQTSFTKYSSECYLGVAKTAVEKI